ncbi:hypothetical protein [Roseomonas elaeocarpi]|uniref:Uncharacterized protein n=1 Tax=Roseomonas elaeocarpi TaxID=907779 RepID=A0ABV6JNW5_9PROT
MDGWLIGVPTPGDTAGVGEERYFAAWVAEEAAALRAVRDHVAAPGGEAAGTPRAVEPLAETALRTYGAAPGGVVEVLAPTS